MLLLGVQNAYLGSNHTLKITMLNRSNRTTNQSPIKSKIKKKIDKMLLQGFKTSIQGCDYDIAFCNALWYWKGDKTKEDPTGKMIMS